MVSDVDKKTVIKYLSQGRTREEISKQFSTSNGEVDLLIKQRYEGYDIFCHRNEFGKPIYILLPKEDDFQPEIKPRIWTYRKQPLSMADKKAGLASYLWVQFPDDLPWDKIIIVPTADVHFGHAHFDERRFDSHFKWIESQENCFTLFLGDIFENALANSPGGAIFEQSLRPREQVRQFRERAAPIAHKVLCAEPGNHEGRSSKLVDIDPLEIVCRDLNAIPYFDEPVFVNILWKGCVFTFYIRHGRTASRTAGGQLNAASKPLIHQEFTMFTIMGHTHGKKTTKENRICRVREFNENGEIIDFKLVEKKQYVVICPGFAGFYGTYAHREEYNPSTSSGVACILYANGDYHVVEDTKQR